MKFIIVIASCFALASALPNERVSSILRSRQNSGSYTISGLGQRKQAVLNAGGNTLDLAIAMLETEYMDTEYAYGDNKQNDAANFGQSQSQWNNGAILNSDLYADVAARWDCQNYYGYDMWFAGHRNGASGLSNPNTADIDTYKSAVQWIQSQIDSDSKYRTDDTRFWVDVTPI